MPARSSTRNPPFRAMLLVIAAITCTPVSGQTTGADTTRGAARAKPCAACHGTPEQAPLPGLPSLAGQQAQFLEAQLFFIREGLRPIPQMEGMLKDATDNDLSDIAAYFAKQQPLRLRTKVDPELQARGAALAKKRGCGTCHMPDLAGQRQIPRINGQREDYLVATIKAYHDNKRSGSDTSMNEVMYGVSEADMQALAHYLSHQP